MSWQSNRTWLLAGAAVVVLAVAGVVAWLVIPGDSANSSAGQEPTGAEATAQGILLDGAELTKLLDQPFRKTMGAPVHGDFDDMEDPPTTGECVGVINVAPKTAYQSAAVRGYAAETWIDAEPGDPGFKPLSATLMFAKEAVVALPSAADAQALFATFAEQWKRCDGRAVNPDASIHSPGGEPSLPGSEMHIKNVRVGDTVLAADIVMEQKTNAPDTRAIGVRGNVIVEVLLPFTGTDGVAGSAVPETSSSDVVRAMLDKVDTG